ncbi:MAG: RNA methyltransferase [Betaproteobacteria bacterium]|nr:RNA methyltransferase [Betaproteobacteria bacterium]
MKHITSRDNPFFKELLRLSESSRQRRKAGQTLLEGVHLLESLHAAGGVPDRLVVSESGLQLNEVARLADQNRGAPVIALSDRLFQEISQLETPVGILAVIPLPRRPRPPRPADFIVLLEEIQDPGNLGSILRSAAAAGAGQVYLSTDCADAWSPKTLRAGMGAHFALTIVEDADLAREAEVFPGKVVAAAGRAERTLYDANLGGRVAFIIGNEGSGISPTLLKAADEIVAIPMARGTESLNAAAAAAVCFFERVRQKAHPR